QRTSRVPGEMTDGVSYGAGEESNGVYSRVAPVAAMKSMSPARPMAGGGATAIGRGRAYGGRAVDAESRGHAAPASPEYKINKKLRTAKGLVEIQIWLTDAAPATIEQITKLGFKVELNDEKLRILFGTIDATKLKALAEIVQVEKI